MADGRHVEKSTNSHISAMDYSIGAKFGTMMHVVPLLLAGI